MNREEGADDSPSLGEFEPLEPKENQPDEKEKNERDEKG